MTLHPLTPKGGAFVLKLGLVFNKNNTPPGVLFLLQEMGFEPSKCNSPVDYCRRRLDGGDPLSALCADADESLTLRKAPRFLYKLQLFLIIVIMYRA